MCVNTKSHAEDALFALHLSSSCLCRIITCQEIIVPVSQDQAPTCIPFRRRNVVLKVQDQTTTSWCGPGRSLVLSHRYRTSTLEKKLCADRHLLESLKVITIYGDALFDENKQLLSNYSQMVQFSFEIPFYTS